MGSRARPPPQEISSQPIIGAPPPQFSIAPDAYDGSGTRKRYSAYRLHYRPSSGLKWNTKTSISKKIENGQY